MTNNRIKAKLVIMGTGILLDLSPLKEVLANTYSIDLVEDDDVLLYVYVKYDTKLSVLYLNVQNYFTHTPFNLGVSYTKYVMILHEVTTKDCIKLLNSCIQAYSMQPYMWNTRVLTCNKFMVNSLFKSVIEIDTFLKAITYNATNSYKFEYQEFLKSDNYKDMIPFYFTECKITYLETLFGIEFKIGQHSRKSIKNKFK